MKNIKTNIFLFALLAASPLMANAQNPGDADSIAAKKKVHVAFRDKEAGHLLGGISYVDMEELQKKDYTMSSLEDLYALVGGWDGNHLWGMDTERLDNNDNGNLPLVIIDGIKRPSNNVLPSEIEQVTFLKGAQAVALYGAKGAKGAILITTKRGKVDGLQITANANTGFHVAKAFPEYLGSAEYMTLYNEACANDGKVAQYSKQDIYNHAVGVNPYRYPNTNYYSSEYIRKAYNRSEGTLEIQGGGTRAHFYTNINYYRMEDLLDFGVAKDNYTDRFSVRGNVDLVVNSSISGWANATATFYNANSNTGDFWAEAATMRPNFPQNASPLIPISMVDPNATKPLATLGRSLFIIDGKYFLGGSSQNAKNAIADCYAGGETSNVRRQFQFDAGFVYDMNKFVKGLSFKTQFAIDYASEYDLSYSNNYATYTPTWSNYNSNDVIVGITANGTESISGHMNMSGGKYRQTISWNGHFDYDHTFAGKHHVTGMLLGNMYTTSASGTGNYHHYTNANLGLQAGYDYMGRYYADLTLAGVHSARLPKGHREAISPSYALGWNIAKESFMKNTKINDLLLSASYSDLNEDIDIYNDSKYFYLYEASWAKGGSSYTWNEGASVERTYSSNGYNSALDYIHRKEFTVSLRGSFFNRLLTAELTYFDTDLTGLIAQAPTAFPSHLTNGLQGSFATRVNNNAQNRKGLDFSITAQKQFGKVHASLGVVGTYLTTNYTIYDETVSRDYQGTQGRPLDVIWGYECVGFYDYNDFDITTDNNGKTVYSLKPGIPKSSLGGTIQPGDLKYKDMDGNGTITPQDRVNLGKNGAFGAPVSLGVNITLKYKNFTLFMLGNGQFGAYGLKNNSYYYMDGTAKYSVNALGRWTPATADVATHPRLSTNTMGNNSQASTFWLYSTDRFNLRKVQLTYDFPKEMWEGKVVKALSIYLNGNDLLTIAKERKLMETNVGYAPQTRFYNLGVKITL